MTSDVLLWGPSLLRVAADDEEDDDDDANNDELLLRRPAVCRDSGNDARCGGGASPLVRLETTDGASERRIPSSRLWRWRLWSPILIF